MKYLFLICIVGTAYGCKEEVEKSAQRKRHRYQSFIWAMDKLNVDDECCEMAHKRKFKVKPLDFLRVDQEDIEEEWFMLNLGDFKTPTSASTRE